jgi:hypothetical protein
MKQGKPVRNLGWGEFILPDQSQNTEIAGARWEFTKMVRRVFPRFFEQLRERVYPSFARLAENRPGYWELGWTFETWQLQSDPDQQLMPCLLGWAREFHADETWILEGALQTLWLWNGDPKLRESLDMFGFRSSCCVDVLTSDEERLFTFEHEGWDPQTQRWGSFRDSIKGKFQKHLDTYERRLSSLMESRGAVRARKRYSADHFAWFALYQLGGLSATKILQQHPALKGDESTILKGVKTAAGLLQWTNVRKPRKAQTRSST